MEKITFGETLRTYLKSGFPILTIDTSEVDRATDAVQDAVADYNEELPTVTFNSDDAHTRYLSQYGYKFGTWDVLNGLRHVTADGGSALVNGTSDIPYNVLQHLIDAREPKPGVLVLQHFNLFWKPGSPGYNYPRLLQLLREYAAVGREHHGHLVIVGSIEDMPAEIRDLTIPIDFDLPTRDELEVFVREYVTESLGLEVAQSGKGNKVGIPESDISGAADAATGMTIFEAETALCMGISRASGKGIDQDVVFDCKANAVRKSGLLEFVRTGHQMSDVGGLSALKDYFSDVHKIFHNRKKAIEYGLHYPKGSMITGISGTGKSLAAKAVANFLKVPLFRSDIGRVMGSLVGETERKTRDLFALAETVAPCVLWLDSVESPC